MEKQLNETEVFDRVRAVLCEVLNVKPEQIVPEAAFKEDLGAESLDLISVISEFEETFDAEISDEDAYGLKTVGDAVTYIKTLIHVDTAAPAQ
jgi:acyl carrier protein